MRRLKNVAVLNPAVPGLRARCAGIDVSFLSLDRIWSDERFDASQTVEFSGDVQSYNPVAEGDILLPKVSPTFAHGRAAIALGLVNERALATSEVFVIRPFDSRDAPYLQYRLRAADFLSEGQASWTGVAGLKRVSANFVMNTRISDLAWERRHRIAAFLDRECAHIRALLNELHGLLDALEAHECDIVARVIGPHATVPLRYRLIGIDQGWSPECESRPAEEGKWAVLKTGCVNYREFRPMEHKRLPDALVPRFSAEIHAGDLLMSRANTRELVGSVALVGDTAGRHLMMSDKLYRLRCTYALRPAFAAVALQGRAVREQIEIAASGASSSMQNISQDLVRSLRIPDLSVDEQERVVIAMDVRASRLRVAREGIQRFSLSLAEYRDSLITEAVTGTLDVTNISERQMEESAHAVMEGYEPEVLLA